MSRSVSVMLETLCEACRASACKFEAAAAFSEREQLRERFVECAEQWGNFAWDLQEEVVRLGREPYYDHGRTVEEDVERDPGDHGIDESTSEGEVSRICAQSVEAASEAYAQLLEDRVLPDRVRSLLKRHDAEIRRSMDERPLRERSHDRGGGFIYSRHGN
jgi:hypothetical protein